MRKMFLHAVIGKQVKHDSDQVEGRQVFSDFRVIYWHNVPGEYSYLHTCTVIYRVHIMHRRVHLKKLVFSVYVAA